MVEPFGQHIVCLPPRVSRTAASIDGSETGAAATMVAAKAKMAVVVNFIVAVLVGGS